MDASARWNSILWRRLAIGGGIAGLIAGIVMAMWTMIASATLEHQGWLTPLYVISSWIIGRDEMVRSLSDDLHWAPGPALLGAGIHMMNSIVFGMLFVVSAALLGARTWSGVALGIIFGTVILVVMSFIVVPVVDAMRMERILSWGTWIVAHLVFGLVLGLWTFARPMDVAAAEPERPPLWEAA